MAECVPLTEYFKIIHAIAITAVPCDDQIQIINSIQYLNFPHLASTPARLPSGVRSTVTTVAYCPRLNLVRRRPRELKGDRAGSFIAVDF